MKYGLESSGTQAPLARPSSNSKLQTRPFAREDALHQETRNCQAENKSLVMGSRWEPDTKTDCRS
jgi:hypothetical protein